jgi:plastocyanin
MPVTLDRHVCGEQPKRKENLLISEHGGIQSTVVSLLSVPKGLPARVPEQSLQLDQRECVFIPHILIVPVNTEIDVLNSDRVMHNFHAISVSNKETNVNQTKTRRRKLSFSYTQSEIVRVVCDVHSWMRAWIVVTEHPYYSVSNLDGRFRLENVPEGSYQVKAWHEELEEQIREVTLTKNKVATLKFEFSAAP